VIGGDWVSFSTRAFESIPEESVTVDVVSADAFAKAGMKTGKKENPKPLVDKVAEAKNREDAVGKITEKAPVVTETSPPPQPKVEQTGREETRSAKTGRRKAEGRAEAEKKQEQPKIDRSRKP